MGQAQCPRIVDSNPLGEASVTCIAPRVYTTHVHTKYIIPSVNSGNRVKLANAFKPVEVSGDEIGYHGNNPERLGPCGIKVWGKALWEDKTRRYDHILNDICIYFYVCVSCSLIFVLYLLHALIVWAPAVAFE